MPIIAQGTYTPITASSASLTPSSNYNVNFDHTNAALVSEMHGKYYTATRAGNTFTAVTAAAGVTIPLNGASLASVFSIWNPIGSTKNLEILAVDIGLTNATTVVTTIGLVYQANLAAAPTLTTAGTPVTGLLGGGYNPQGKYYSALTHAGTPTACAVISSFGATSTTNAGPIHVDFDGKLILPPASVISVAAFPAAMTQPTTIALTWSEWPL